MVKIGDLQIEVVPDESTKLTNEVTDKPVENEANIGDHINHKPIEFTVDFVLAGPDAEDQRDKLEEMSKSDEVFQYTDVKSYRSYENIVILDLNFDTNVEISNGYTGSLSLKQIQIAEQETALVNILGEDPATGEEVQGNAGDAENRSPGEENVNEETTDPSFLASLIGIGDDDGN